MIKFLNKINIPQLMAEKEGVMKYKPLLVLGPKLEPHKIQVLNYWRDELYSKGLIGQDPNRYGGAGYGNVSQIDSPYNYFIISGTQTGGLERLTEEHYTTVVGYHPQYNMVIYIGPKGSIEPSSEAMTHGTLYDLNDSIGYVFHGHHKGIWENSRRLGIPTTKESVEYGTPQMAEEFLRVHRDNKMGARGGISMGGHEDGIVTFAETPEEAWAILKSYLEGSSKITRHHQFSHSLISHNL